MTFDAPTIDEPTTKQYAEFGRYVAALIGSNTERWDPVNDYERIALGALDHLRTDLDSNLTGYRNTWRKIADEYGLEHDGTCQMCQSPASLLNRDRRCADCANLVAAESGPVRFTSGAREQAGTPTSYDPEPYLTGTGDRLASPVRGAAYAPRAGYDSRPNQLLGSFRRVFDETQSVIRSTRPISRAELAEAWSQGHRMQTEGVSIMEINHMRRVLSRYAQVFG